MGRVYGLVINDISFLTMCDMSNIDCLGIDLLSKVKF
jgi:hypothetical protein